MINFYLRLKNRKDNKNGFTISEMLITTFIVGIMAAISVPSMLRWVENEKQNAYLREIISYLELVKKKLVDGMEDVLCKPIELIKIVSILFQKNIGVFQLLLLTVTT